MAFNVALPPIQLPKMPPIDVAEVDRPAPSKPIRYPNPVGLDDAATEGAGLLTSARSTLHALNEMFGPEAGVMGDPGKVPLGGTSLLRSLNRTRDDVRRARELAHSADPSDQQAQLVKDIDAMSGRLDTLAPIFEAYDAARRSYYSEANLVRDDALHGVFELVATPFNGFRTTLDQRSDALRTASIALETALGAADREIP